MREGLEAALVRRLKNATCTRLRCADHSSPAERPAEVAAALSALVARPWREQLWAPPLEGEVEPGRPGDYQEKTGTARDLTSVPINFSAAVAVPCNSGRFCASSKAGTAKIAWRPKAPRTSADPPAISGSGFANATISGGIATRGPIVSSAFVATSLIQAR